MATIKNICFYVILIRLQLYSFNIQDGNLRVRLLFQMKGEFSNKTRAILLFENDANAAISQLKSHDSRSLSFYLLAEYL
jgi:hypothetical protein